MIEYTNTELPHNIEKSSNEDGYIIETLPNC